MEVCCKTTKSLQLPFSRAVFHGLKLTFDVFRTYCFVIWVPRIQFGFKVELFRKLNLAANISSYVFQLWPTITSNRFVLKLRSNIYIKSMILIYLDCVFQYVILKIEIRGRSVISEFHVHSNRCLSSQIWNRSFITLSMVYALAMDKWMFDIFKYYYRFLQHLSKEDHFCLISYSVA